MIKLRKDNKIVLGLSDMNVKRIVDGSPILFNMSELNLPPIDMQIFIQKKDGVDLQFTKGDVAVHANDMVSVGIGNDVIKNIKLFGFMFECNQLDTDGTKGLKDIKFIIFSGDTEEAMTKFVQTESFINSIMQM